MKTDIYYSDGNLGLGTNSPVRHFHVYGAPDSSEAKMRLGEGENDGAVAAELLLESSSAGNGALTLDVAKNGSGRGDILLARYGGNVGIGTSTPTAHLDVNGVTSFRDFASWAGGGLGSGYTGTAAAFLNGTGPSDLGIRAEGDLYLSAGGSGNPQAVLDASGNFGVGNVTPTRRLDVTGGIKSTENTELFSGGDASFYVGSSPGLGQYGALEWDDELKIVRLWNHGGVPAPGPGTPQVAIASDGNVGIGTATPGATLDVNGTARLKSYSGAPPFGCDAQHAGTIALTGNYKMCICNGSTWTPADASPQCAW